jgi:hypothetical protein
MSGQLAPGARVYVPGRHRRTATLLAVGGCGWHRCQHGTHCATVREDGRSTTTNYHQAQLELATTEGTTP